MGQARPFYAIKNLNAKGTVQSRKNGFRIFSQIWVAKLAEEILKEIRLFYRILFRDKSLVPKSAD